jgi:hypothetical protein
MQNEKRVGRPRKNPPRQRVKPDVGAPKKDPSQKVLGIRITVKQGELDQYFGGSLEQAKAWLNEQILLRCEAAEADLPPNYERPDTPSRPQWFSAEQDAPEW